MHDSIAGFLGVLVAATSSIAGDGVPVPMRTRGAVTARPACGYDDGPRNLLLHSTDFPRAPWQARASSPDLLPRLGASAETGPSGAPDAAAVEFDAGGAPTPERWCCLETVASCTPGTTYTFSFSVKGPEGSFLTARGAAGAGFSRIPLNGRWQRVHLTEQATAKSPTLRIGLAAHGTDEPKPSSAVRVLLSAPQLVAGRGVVPYQPTGASVPPPWPLELVPPGAVRTPCDADDRGEREAMNLLRWSTKLDHGAWTRQGLAAPGVAPGPSPIGAPDAALLRESEGPGPHALSQAFIGGGGGPVTASIYVKPRERRAVLLALSSNDVLAEARFDLDAGALRAETGGNAAIERVGQGWYRLWLTVPSVAAGAGTFSLALLGRADAATENDGDGKSGLLAWGPQVESGPAPSSYIPTFFVPESRGADEPVKAPEPP